MAAILSLVLRGGVLLSAFLVLLGGLGVLWTQSSTPIQALIQSHPDSQGWSPTMLVAMAWQGHPQALIRLGLLLLILTPVARVALAAFLFFLERDWLYGAIALWVLLLLMLGLGGSL